MAEVDDIAISELELQPLQAISNDDMFPLESPDGTAYRTTRDTFRLDLGSQVFNVKSYGALGDGTTDDTDAIQDAINNAGVAGGGIVFFPGGTYIVAADRTTPTLYGSAIAYVGLTIGYDNVVLMGSGVESTTLKTPDFSPSAVNDARHVMIVNSVAGLSGIQIRDMTLEEPDFTSGMGGFWGMAVYFIGVGKSLLRDLRMNKGAWRFDGSVVAFNGTTKELTTDAEDILVDNVVITSALGSAALFQTKHVKVTNSQFRQFHDDPLLIAQTGQDITVEGSTFDFEGVTGGGSTAGILVTNDGATTTDIKGLQDVKLRGNTIRNGGTDLAGGITIRTVSNCQIIGNTIEKMQFDGIRMDTKTIDVTIIGNIIKNNGLAGGSTFAGINILADNSGEFEKNITIVGNVIGNNTGKGIWLGSVIDKALRHIVITGNTVYDDNASVAVQTVGIKIDSGAAETSDINVSDNAVYSISAATNYEINPYSGGIIVFTGEFIGAQITPSSASAPGTAGTIVYDSSFVYVCTAGNTWKRVAIATW